ncbi:MAG: hypothetical protein C4320_02110, partial [Armatimonadota bacterium]
MKPVILTALGMVLLFGTGLLAVERRRHWFLIALFGVGAAVCLFLGKGQIWLAAMAIGLGAIG